ncbi:mitochondrial genome maintenance exonuclease 1 [Diachasma alloeum]|nr:mitochondrial genome maintenance exonuclease 1 [Diachasma alloeum]
MLLPRMCEVVSTVGRLNLLRLPIRKNATKAKLVKNRMKEDKANFGPLLETAKERKRKLKSARKSKNTEVPDVPEAGNSKNDVNDAELSWTISTTKLGNLKFLRKTDKDDKQKSSSRQSEVQQLSKFTQLVESNNPNKTTKTIMTKILNSDNPRDQSGQDEILPFSSPKIQRKVEDLAEGDIETNDDKSCYGSIGEETLLKSGRSDTLYFPITNSCKGLNDEWENRGIVSLKPGEQKEYCLPGVTRILNKTMSEEAKLILEKWKQKMILKLGDEGFDEYSKKLLEDSKALHLLIQKSLRREEIPEVPEHLKLSFNSIKLTLKDLSDVRMLESHVIHPALGYRGFIDCVASYRGNLCIIDWKKSEKIKTLSTTYDSPLQVSAYIGALNADPNYPFQVKSGLVAIAYTSGQPPSVFEFSAARLEFYWREWLKRLAKYKSLTNI